jgi:mRNA interferase RelE/StbE
MASYNVLIRRSAADELRQIPKKDLRRIVERIGKFSVEPRPEGCEKLSGEERFRVRQGDYWIVYAIDDGARTVEIVKIGHRSEIYRR